MSIIFKVMQKTLSNSSYLAPSVIGKLAFQLFSTPIAPKTPNNQRSKTAQEVLDKSTKAFVNSGKQRIQTYFWKATKKRREQQVLLVHGWASKTLYMTSFVEPLLELGFDIIAVDLPAHGESSGRQLNFREAAQVIQDINAHFGNIYAMLGHSFGGAMVSFALAGGEPLRGQAKTENVVLIAAPNRLAGVAERFCNHFELSAKARSSFEQNMSKLAQRDIKTVAAEDVYKQTRVPVLVIHDEKDQEVPFSDAAHYQKIPSATLIQTKGLGHRRILYDETVVEHVTQFLLRN